MSGKAGPEVSDSDDDLCISDLIKKRKILVKGSYVAVELEVELEVEVEVKVELELELEVEVELELEVAIWY